MDAPLWKRIGELFEAARKLDGADRVKYLKEQCGDNEALLAQVLSLLEADGGRGPLDSAPTVSALTVPEIIAGRFRIIRYIADGGMGTVYEAEDLRLNDRVALKTIRADIASNPKVVERFKREILLGKKVTHPNVCRIHDLGVDRTETGVEFLFLTMQFLNGETLASRIKRGPIPQTEALPLIEDMADALSAAHQAEVIHRDFKSGNVMLVNGSGRTSAVVTDFGLARGTHDDRSLHAGLVGTVDYMAPEQIKGEEITPSADIYALGVVMYEMVTGQRPFNGDSKVTIITKHLHDEPRPPKELVPKLDRNWDEAILRCLRKLPGERYESTAEIKAAVAQSGAKPLRRVASRARMKPTLLGAIVILLLLIGSGFWFYRQWTALPEQKHIAVLPFENIGRDSANLPFNDGVVETLTSKLSQLERYQRSFWVIPSSDTRQITSLDDAYRKLHVTLAVTGSIQHTEKGVIVTANLVDPKNHKQLSSRTIRAASVDLDVLQERVWEAVADMIDLEVDPETVRSLATGGTKQPEAYGSYLRGVGYLQHYDKVDQAIDAFTSAVARDPQYGDAYAGLGDAYATKYFLTKDPEWIDKATENVRQAIALKDTSAPVYVALGKIYQRTGRLDDALTEFRRALDADPASVQSQYHLGDVYAAQGETEEAEAAYQTVISRWPWYWLGYSGLGTLYYGHGKFAEAAQQFRKMIDLAPDNPLGYYDLGGVYIALGKYDDAIEVLSKGLNKGPEKSLDKSIVVRETSGAWSNLGTAYMYLGRQEEAIDAMQRATNINPHNHVLWRNLADSYNQVPSRATDARKAYEKALEAAQIQVKVNPKNVEAISGIALYYAHLDKKAEAQGFMSQALSLSPNDSDVLFTSALVYEIIGERTKALKELEEAVTAGYSLEEVEKEPELRNLRSDSRYQRWLRQYKSENSNRTSDLHSRQSGQQLYATTGLRRRHVHFGYFSFFLAPSPSPPPPPLTITFGSGPGVHTLFPVHCVTVYL